MKRVFKWIGIIFLTFIVLIAAMAFPGMQKTRTLTIQDVDMSQVQDGTYTGTYQGFRFTNIVEVAVEDHRIVSIDVIKTQREELSETLKNEVISAQSPVIDMVSGATLDQNAFLKAVVNALMQATAD
ncbi:MAG: FMN-binding protein [Firmicutes bacterium HGW-Firmicutes-9]|jgi:uncharacterized protein with FMN-binding domain|nr:MAG: FMN-binding protein [Firmicutes bacterium HGW-Firmicutes-9]